MAAELKVTLRLDANDEGMRSTVQQNTAAINKLNESIRAGRGAHQQARTAAREHASALRATREESSLLGDSYRRLRGAVGAYLGLQTVRKLIQEADGYANMAAKIRLAAGAGEDFARTQSALFGIAQRTSAPLESTVQLYSRMAAALRGVGASQREILGITETINQAFVVSGATTAEASAAVVQLSQAFASGALRGEEFNSIAEQAPRLMQALADSLGVSRGALRGLAEQGKLTSDVLRRALTGDQAQKIAEEFAQVPLTVGRAVQQLQNAFTRYIGEADQASGATRTLAEAIKAVADNIGPVADALVTVATVALAWYGTRLLSAIYANTAALLAQRAVLATVGAQWQALGIQATGATVSMGRGLLTVRNGLNVLFAAFAGWQVGTYIRDQFQTARIAAAYFVQSTLLAWEQIKGAAKLAWAGIQAAFEGALNFMREGLAQNVGAWAGLFERLPEAMGGQKIAAKLREWEESIRPTTDAATGLSLAVAQINMETAMATAAIQVNSAEQLNWEYANDGSRKATEENAAAVSGLGRNLLGAGADAAEAAKQLAKWSQAVEDLANSVLVDQAAEQALELAIAIEEATAKGRTDLVKQLERALAKLGDTIEKDKLEAAAAAASFEQLLDPVQELLAGYEREAALLGMNEQERRIHEAGIRAETDARRALDEAVQRGKVYSSEEREQIVATAAARAEWLEGLRIASEQSRRYTDVIRQGFDQVADVIAGALTGAFDSFEDFGRAILDIAKKMVADLIAEFLRLQVIGPMFQSIFGGTGTASGQGLTGTLLQMGASYLGGGTPANAYGPMASGYAYGGTAGGSSPWLSQIPYLQQGGAGGAPGAAGMGGMGMAGAGFMTGGAALGYQWAGYPGAIVGGVAGLAAYGAIAGTATGAALGIGAGTAAATAGAAAGGGAAGAVAGAGAAVPVVGWIIAALALLYIALQDTTAQIHVIGDNLVGSPGYRNLAPGSNYESELGGFTIASIDLVSREARDEIGQAIVDFDNSLAALLDEDQLGRAVAALADFRIALEDEAITVENVVGQRFRAVLATFDQDVQGFVNAAQGLQAQVERFALAVSAQRVLADLGEELEMPFREFLDVLEGLRGEGEEIGDTLERVVGGMVLLRDSLDLLGVDLGRTGEEFITFAAEMVEAAGGLEEATALWERYANGFLTEQERLQGRLVGLQAEATSQLEALGLDADTTLSEFRSTFEDLLPTLSPEEVVQWLRAGDALLDLAEASAEFARATGEAGNIVRRMGSPFYEALLAIADAEEEAAQAARAQGATETRLGLIHLEAARRAAQAVTILRAQTQDLIARLYGGIPGSLDLIEQRIAELEGTASGSFGETIGDAIDDTFDRWMRGLQGVRDFLDDLVLNTQLTTLTPEQQLAEARRQYEQTLAAAQMGDVGALEALPQLAQQYLELARGFWSSGDQYQAIFDAVRGQLGGILGMPAPGGGAPAGGPGGAGTVTLVPSEELRALYEQRDALLAQQEGAMRAQLALELSNNLRELAGALGRSVLVLAEEMGVDLERLATDLGVNLEELNGESIQAIAVMAHALGVSLTELTAGLGLELTDLGEGVTELAESVGMNLEELTAESVRGLAELANALGVELAELAESVGVDLGDLADEQSLLNDALEGVIGDLPEEQRDLLRPLLGAVEGAVTDADANAAIADLELAVDGLAPELRDLLAPYFQEIDPSTTPPDVAELVEANGWLEAILGATRDVAAAVRGETGAAAGELPEFQTGAAAITTTGRAVVHEGEMILDPEAADVMRRYGINVSGAGGDDAEVVAQLVALRADTRAGDVAVAAAVRDLSTRVAGVEAATRAADNTNRQWMENDRRRRGGG